MALGLRVYRDLSIQAHLGVQPPNLSTPVLIDWLEDPLVVEPVHLGTHLELEVSVFREELLVQELPGEGVPLRGCHRHVEELRVRLVDHVVVADKLGTLLLFGDYILAAVNAIGDKAETDANEAFLDEIKFRDFHILVVDNFVVLMRLEYPWLKTICNVAKHLTLIVSV